MAKHAKSNLTHAKHVKAKPRRTGLWIGIAALVALMAIGAVFAAQHINSTGAQHTAIYGNPQAQATPGYHAVTVSWTKVYKADRYRVILVQDRDTFSDELIPDSLSYTDNLYSYTIENLLGKHECTVTVEAHVEDVWHPIDPDAASLEATALTVTPEGPSTPRWFLEVSDRIVQAAKSTPTTEEGLCASWVTNVLTNAGYYTRPADACTMYWNWCTQDYSFAESSFSSL